MRTNPLHFWVKLIFRIDLSPFLGLSYVGFKIGLGQFRLTSGFKIGLGHLRLTSNSSKSLNNTFNINLQTRINPMFWLMSGLPLRSKIGSDWVRLVLRVSLLRVQNRVGSGQDIKLGFIPLVAAAAAAAAVAAAETSVELLVPLEFLFHSLISFFFLS